MEDAVRRTRTVPAELPRVHNSNEYSPIPGMDQLEVKQ